MSCSLYTEEALASSCPRQERIPILYPRQYMGLLQGVPFGYVIAHLAESMLSPCPVEWMADCSHLVLGSDYSCHRDRHIPLECIAEKEKIHRNQKITFLILLWMYLPW